MCLELNKYEFSVYELKLKCVNVLWVQEWKKCPVWQTCFCMMVKKCALCHIKEMKEIKCSDTKLNDCIYKTIYYFLYRLTENGKCMTSYTHVHIIYILLLVWM